MSGNLGLGEPYEPTSPLQDVSVAARIFDKNRWDDISEDMAHGVAITAEGQTVKMKAKIIVQHGSGACDLELHTLKLGDIVGQVVRVQLYIEGHLAADCGFSQYIGAQHRLAVQMRVVGVPEESIGALP